MVQVDLWSEPMIKEPSVNSEPVKEVKKRGRPKKVHKEDLYVVTAGTSRATQAPLFLYTFEDCDDWSISRVPAVMNKARALEMMEKAQQFINDNPKKYGLKPPTLELESIENQEIYELVKYLL